MYTGACWTKLRYKMWSRIVWALFALLNSLTDSYLNQRELLHMVLFYFRNLSTGVFIIAVVYLKNPKSIWGQTSDTLVSETVFM
jgi:hypothetical protein